MQVGYGKILPSSLAICCDATFASDSDIIGVLYSFCTGNQAPTSKGGRALVFTAGFLSILAFASVLGKLPESQI